LTEPPKPDILHILLGVLVVILDLASAIFGILGTYWMAKRYAPNLFSGIKFAFLSLKKYVEGLGSDVERFYIEEYRANEDVPELPGTTAMGLNFLFVAFVLQFLKIVLGIFVGG